MSGIKDARGPIKVLDNGCGDGIIAQLVWDSLDDALKANLELVCGDLSPVMVKFASERIEAGGWSSAKALVIDMQVCWDETKSHPVILTASVGHEGRDRFELYTLLLQLRRAVSSKP